MPSREQVFCALEKLVKENVPGSHDRPIKKVTRRMTLPASVPPLDLPCLMIWEQPENTDDFGNATPAKRTWEAFIILVDRNESKEVPGAMLINPVLEQIEAITKDFATDVQTLGGLVSWVKIIGKTVKETGDTDPNGLGGAVVPIKILVP